ncbi:MAG TPA: TetR/AcrR family transcriptional regulator [Agromyces sp.]
MRTVTERSDAVLAVATAFRRFGYEGASISQITEQTGLGKGSLYNFFPGGKEDMATAVLDEVGAWFQAEVYEPLLHEGTAAARITAMFDAVEAYFTSRQLVCLFGAFALGQERTRFSEPIQRYFGAWIDALRTALHDGGAGRGADDAATDIVSGIQGALVLARALDDISLFHGALERMRARALTLLA